MGGADRAGADHHDGVVEPDRRCPCGRRSRPTAGRRTSRARATGRPGSGTGSSARCSGSPLAPRRRPGWSKPISSPCRQRFSAPLRHMRQRPHHSVEMQCTASPTAMPSAADLGLARAGRSPAPRRRSRGRAPTAARCAGRRCRRSGRRCRRCRTRGRRSSTPSSRAHGVGRAAHRPCCPARSRSPLALVLLVPMVGGSVPVVRQLPGEGRMIEFIFMLTRDDVTLADARAVYASVAGAGVRHVGCKDVGLPQDELAALMDDIRAQRPHDLPRGRLGDAGGRRCSPRAAAAEIRPGLPDRRHADRAGPGDPARHRREVLPVRRPDRRPPLPAARHDRRDRRGHAPRGRAGRRRHQPARLPLRRRRRRRSPARSSPPTDLPVICAGSVDSVERIRALERAAAPGRSPSAPRRSTASSSRASRCAASCTRRWRPRARERPPEHGASRAGGRRSRRLRG